jgi:uncharacterized protein YciI
MTDRPSESRRFAYLYFMKDATERISDMVASHVSYWRKQGLPGYLGGPFQDRTGGLIVFQAESAEGAERTVDADPFIREGLLEVYWLKQWTPEEVHNR